MANSTSTLLFLVSWVTPPDHGRWYDALDCQGRLRWRCSRRWLSHRVGRRWSLQCCCPILHLGNLEFIIERHCKEDAALVCHVDVLEIVSVRSLTSTRSPVARILGKGLHLRPLGWSGHK